jgi:hypothetical protein
VGVWVDVGVKVAVGAGVAVSVGENPGISPLQPVRIIMIDRKKPKMHRLGKKFNSG